MDKDYTYKGKVNVKKIKLYLDCDDVILNSMECIIKILNLKNNTHKTIDDLRDFYYKSIDKDITKEDILNMYESNDFWDIVKINNDFVESINSLKEKFRVIVVTSGTKKSIDRKKEKLIPFGLELVDTNTNIGNGLCKKEINMCDGIQVDDNISNLLYTNAKIKILLKKDRDFSYNNAQVNIENLYIVRNWSEIMSILDFFYNNPQFI